MKTELTLLEFESRLKEITKSGDPIIMGTPLFVFALNNSQKVFFGEIGNGEFKITKNPSLIPTPFTINGKFKQSETGTNVDYKITPIWFGYLWIRILPIVAIILINFLLIRRTEELMLDLILPVNIFLLLMFLPIPITNILKRKLESNFVESFEFNEN